MDDIKLSQPDSSRFADEEDASALPPESAESAEGAEGEAPSGDALPDTAAAKHDKYGFPIGAPMLSPPEYEEMLEVLSGSELLGLFSYLKGITRSLPANALADFLLSDERIQMEYVIDRLSGKPGLKQSLLFRAQQRHADDERIWPVIPRDILPAKINVRETLEYLEKLVGDLPDEGFAVAMKHRLETIRGKFELCEE